MDGLKQQKFIRSQFWRFKSEIKVWAGPFLLWWLLGIMLPCLLSFLLLLAVLGIWWWSWVWRYIFRVSLSAATRCATDASGSVSRFSRYKGTSHWIRVHPDLVWPHLYLMSFLSQFSSVAHSCPTLQPHGLQHTRLPCPSPTPRAVQDFKSRHI